MSTITLVKACLIEYDYLYGDDDVYITCQDKSFIINCYIKAGLEPPSLKSGMFPSIINNIRTSPYWERKYITLGNKRLSSIYPSQKGRAWIKEYKRKKDAGIDDKRKPNYNHLIAHALDDSVSIQDLYGIMQTLKKEKEANHNNKSLYKGYNGVDSVRSIESIDRDMKAVTEILHKKAEILKAKRS